MSKYPAIIKAIFGLGLILGNSGAYGKNSKELNSDIVALEAQKKAVTNLEKIIKKSSPANSNYPAMLMRLAEYQQQLADIYFRIEHAQAFANKKKINLSTYCKVLDQAITNATQVISDYSEHHESTNAFLLRASANENCGRHELAAKDFLKIIGKHPNTQQEHTAYLRLAEISGNKGDHRQVIEYLDKIKNRKDHENYIYVIYRIAWSHFQLMEMDAAIRHALELNAAVASRKAINGKSDGQALLTELLAETPEFALRWLESSGAGNFQQAYQIILKLHSTVSEEIRSENLIRFAKLLRSRDRMHDLIALQNNLQKDFPEKQSTLEAMILVSEDLFAKMQFKSFSDSLDRLAEHSLRNNHKLSPASLHSMLLDVSERLQAATKKEKNAKGASLLVLHKVYQTILKISDSSNPIYIRTRYNLAELLAAKGDLAKASEHFLWAFRNGKNFKEKGVLDIDPVQAGLRACRLQYEILLQQGVIPKQFVPAHIAHAKVATKTKEFLNWETTLRDLLTAHSGKLDNEQLDFFASEYLKTLYSLGYVEDASNRMRAIVERNPESRNLRPFTSIVVDTFVKSERWVEAEKFARIFSENSAFSNDKSHTEALKKVAGNAAYKIVEAAFNREDHAFVLRSESVLNKKYPQSLRAPDWRKLLAMSAVKLGKTDRAITLLESLSNVDTTKEVKNDARHLRMQLLEDEFRFEDAANALMEFLLARPQVAEIAELEKFLHLALLADSKKLLDFANTNEKFCNERNRKICDQFFTLALVENAKYSDQLHFQNKLSKKVMPLFEIRSGQDFWTNLQFLEKFAAVSDSLPKLILLHLQRHIIDKSEIIFANGRVLFPNLKELNLDEAAISERLALLRRFENSVDKILKINAPELQAVAVAALGRAYTQTAAEISSLPIAADISAEEQIAFKAILNKTAAPIYDKGKAYLERAFEMGSNSGISGTMLTELGIELERKKLFNSSELRRPAARAEMIPFFAISDINAAVTLKPNQATVRERFVKRFLKATQNGSWLEASYLARLLRQRVWIDDLGLTWLSANMLERMGARGAAVAAASDALASSAKHPASNVNMKLALLQAFAHSHARARTVEILNTFSPAIESGLNAADQEFLKQLRAWISEGDV